MSRRLKYIVFFFGILMLTGAIAAIAIPKIIASKESKIIEKLKKKGISLHYNNFETHLDTLIFSDLNMRVKKAGFSVACDFSKIEINLSLIESLSGGPKIEEIQIEDGTCNIEKLDKKSQTKKESTPSKRQIAFPKDFEIPNFNIEKFVIRYKQHSLGIDHLENKENKILGNLVLRALGEKYPIHVTGRVASSTKIKLTPIDHPVFQANVLGNKFELGFVGLDLDLPKKKVSLSVQKVSVQREGIAIIMERFGVELQNGKPLLSIHGGQVSISPRLLKKLITKKKKKVDIDDFDVSEPLISPLALLEKLYIELKDASLILQLNAENKKAIVLAEHANGKLNHGELSLEGHLAEGTFRMYALMSPSAKKIERFDLNFQNILLGKIPGMPSGRSLLPNRGTSGKLDGKLSGAFHLETPWFSGLDNPAEFTGNLSWEDGVIDLAGVSKNAVENIQISTTFNGQLNSKIKELKINGHLKSGSIPFSFHSKLNGWSEDINLSLQVQGPKRACSDYFKAIPASLWGPFKNALLENDAELIFNLESPYSRPLETKFSIKGYEKCVVKNLQSTQKFDVKFRDKKSNFSDVLWLNKPFIKKIKEVKKGAKIFVGPGTKNYISLNTMPKYVGGAAYLSEQINFYSGRAINFGLVQRALARNLDEGRFVYGGSTVTQQLVKNLFLSRDKTISRKLQEMLIAWRIENAISKDRILELYLNCIEFGPNLYGIGRAARHYFQKSATALSPKESVFLAMLKPAPWRGVWYVNRGATPTNPYFVERTDILLERLLTEEMIDEETLALEKRIGLTWENGKYSKVLAEEEKTEGLIDTEKDETETPK